MLRGPLTVHQPGAPLGSAHVGRRRREQAHRDHAPRPRHTWSSAVALSDMCACNKAMAHQEGRISRRVTLVLPWTEVAPTGSSMCSQSKSGIVEHVMPAPMKPMNSASHDEYRKQPAATNPRNSWHLDPSYLNLEGRSGSLAFSDRAA